MYDCGRSYDRRLIFVSPAHQRRLTIRHIAQQKDDAGSMGIFEHLRQLRQFERRHMPFLHTMEDLDLVLLIGHHQTLGELATMKRIMASEIGAAATLQRRVARLKQLGVVISKPQETDRRNMTLELSVPTLRIFQRLERQQETPKQRLSGRPGITPQ